MRSALRTSIVTAALAGALLAPAATAFAAPAPQAVTPVTATASQGDRFGGETVLVGPGRIAVLRNDVEGPEIWIRAVAPDWKPADGWAGRVLAKLDNGHLREVVDGVEYILADADNGRYGLNVHVQGEGASDGFYLLPEATTKPSEKPTAKPSEKPSAKPSATPADKAADKGTDKTAAKPSATTGSAPKAQAVGQTAVVPKGGVAAGAEIAAEDSDDSTTVYAGAGLAAIVAGLGAAFIARRRARTQR
ncbi:hypothetical protein [Streptomyces yangpuensis]|uniref:hypothetical protein n=1 Tax=Streptomyces yangpuensis TaxID=1648182 RepID=UPI0037168D7F